MRFISNGIKIDFQRESTGTSHTLYDILPFAASDTEGSLQVSETTEIDAIAVKAWGRNAEPSWYRIADHNREVLFDRDLDFSQIKEFSIPRQ